MSEALSYCPNKNTHITSSGDPIMFGYDLLECRSCCGAGVLRGLVVDVSTAKGYCDKKEQKMLYKSIFKHITREAQHSEFSLIVAYSTVPEETISSDYAYVVSHAKYDETYNFYNMFSMMGFSPCTKSVNPKTGNTIVGFHITVDEIKEMLND